MLLDYLVLAAAAPPERPSAASASRGPFAASAPPPAVPVFYPQTTPGGIYFDFTKNGTAAGVGSGSYGLQPSEYPWPDGPPCGMGGQSASDRGRVLLAINVFTGEVLTEITSADQWFDPRHQGSAGALSTLGTADAFAARGGTYPTTADAPISPAAIETDHLFFTTERRPGTGWCGQIPLPPNSFGSEITGMYVMASQNGGVAGIYNPGLEGRITYDPHFLADGELVGSVGYFDGDEMRVDNGLFCSFGSYILAGQRGWAGLHGIGFRFGNFTGWIQVNVSISGLIVHKLFNSAPPPPLPRGRTAWQDLR